MFSQSIKFVVALALTANLALGGTVTFTPTTPTVVAPGANVSFQVEIAVQNLLAFSTADVIIGANSSNNVAFSYSFQWVFAFANVSPITQDIGFYTQDVFVGGNNATAVGSQMILGIVTIDTTNMTDGCHLVQVNHVIDLNNSSMTLDGIQEFLDGSAIYIIQGVSVDGNCDGKVDAQDHRIMASCLQGPGQPFPTGCSAYDTDIDGDVDAADFSALTLQYTGS